MYLCISYGFAANKCVGEYNKEATAEAIYLGQRALSSTVSRNPPYQNGNECSAYQLNIDIFTQYVCLFLLEGWTPALTPNPLDKSDDKAQQAEGTHV